MLLLLVVVLAAACTPREVPDGLARPLPAALPLDSVRGELQLVGTAGDPMLLLRDSAGQLLRLREGPQDELRAADGLTVLLRGVQPPSTAAAAPADPREFLVRSFTALATDGIAVLDGELVLGDDGAVTLVVGTQRLPVRATLPVALRAAHGARIYWAGSLDVAPLAYGILRPAPR